MKRLQSVSLLVIGLLCTGLSLQAQDKKWDALSTEEKVEKVKAFRQDNQVFLKQLGLSQDQLDDIDNVNLCYLASLDRIDRYGKDSDEKKKFAKRVTETRSVELNRIMGEENRKKYQEYVGTKLEKFVELNEW